MAEDSHIAGAPITVTIKERELKLYPLRDREFAELDEWVRSSMVRTALSSLRDSDSQKFREEVISVAMRASIGLTWMSGDGKRAMGTVAGIAALVSASTRGAVGHDEARDLLFGDLSKIDEINLVFRRLNPGRAKELPPNGNP